MLENHVYDLMEQLVEKSKRLWRVKNYYRIDSLVYDDCHKFWGKM